MDGTKFLGKNLQNYEEKGNYCSGEYNEPVNSLVESFIAITNNIFRCASSHRRGKSKRLKEDKQTSKSFWFKHENSLIPIPFNGYLFEILGTECWTCSVEEYTTDVQPDTGKRKRLSSSSQKCSAAIQVRTVKVFTDYFLDRSRKSSRREQEALKTALLDALSKGETPNYKVIHYCRFPLPSAHCKHERLEITSYRLNRKVAKKIQEFANNGIHDVEYIQSKLADYVKNNLFKHLENNELPSPENSRYFPTKRVIYNHLMAAVGPIKRAQFSSFKSVQPTPLVMNLLHQSSTAKEKLSQCSEVGIIAVHGGAGFHSDEKWPGYHRLCDEACWLGVTCLKEGGTAGEAVALAVKSLEDSELTNAGMGSNLTEDGKVECDASVMDCSISADGRPLFGAVTGVSSIKNPVSAAYRLSAHQLENPKLTLGRVPPSVMSGEGAEKWARAHQVEMCDHNELISDSSRRTWQKYRKKLLEALTNSQNGTENSFNRFDTVGAVAIDCYGNVAAAASSGGLLMKLPGRVGQAAMYGCGCWAENGGKSKPAVAVATSGCGEQLMMSNSAVTCARNMQDTDLPYNAMKETLINNVLNCPYLCANEPKHAGMLALHQTKDKSQSITELVWGHTTRSMLIGHMSTKDSRPEVLISRLPDEADPGKSLSVSGTWVKVATERNDATERNEERAESDSCVTPASKSLVQILPGQQVDGTNDNLTIDSDISLMYISTDVDGLSVKDCDVKLSDEYNRIIDNEFEEKINERWQQRLKDNPRLFNASKFRIDSVEEVEAKLEFRLGLTTYKDYMETNWSADVKLLHEKGERACGNPQAYLAEPLGVAAVVATSDGQAIFQRRSRWVAEEAGKIDVPGGHPEPSEVLGDGMDIDMSRMHADDVIKEIFTSQLKEVRDEVNVPLDALTEPRLMGLMRNKHSAGRPVCYFLIRCSLSASEIRERYRAGGVETDESTEIIFKTVKDLTYLENESPDFWAELCPNGKAAVTLYSMLDQVKKGRSPYQLR